MRDPARKEALAELYREAGGDWIIRSAERMAGRDDPNEAVTRSAAHLARHLGDVPAIVIPTIWGTHDGSGRPGLFDSVIQAAWSFCLALRSRGLGSAWTTLHLAKAPEVANLFGIPEGVTQIALFPVAYTVGRPAPVRPPDPPATPPGDAFRRRYGLRRCDRSASVSTSTGLFPTRSSSTASTWPSRRRRVATWPVADGGARAGSREVSAELYREAV